MCVCVGMCMSGVCVCGVACCVCVEGSWGGGEGGG